MLLAIRYCLCALFKVALAFRYRLRVTGKDQIRGLTGPVLVLPNHPGYIDPPLVLSTVWPDLKVRPLVYEGIGSSLFLGSIFKMLNAQMVPDLEKASVQARDQAQKAINTVITGLKKGENFILWPSGRLQRRTGGELLGGVSGLTEILKAVPEATIILVRTRGLWGSRFSWAYTSERPDLTEASLGVLGWVLASLVFLLPRRNVTMTLEKLDRSKLPSLERDQINAWFERWYNVDIEEPTFVPYHLFFGPKTYDYPEPPAQADVDLSKVKPETKAGVAEILHDVLDAAGPGRAPKPDTLTADTVLETLGIDSLDRMDLMLRVEQQFGFRGEGSPATVGHLWALAQGLVEGGPPKPAPKAWFTVPTGAVATLGDTIPEAWVQRALACKQDVCAADDLAGATTYERMLTGSLLLAKRFKKLEGDNVGLLLPASVGCDTAFLALHLAGKLPVVLNWTTGPAGLAHAAKLMGLKKVVTSKAFVDRTAIKVEGTEYVYMETFRPPKRKKGETKAAEPATRDQIGSFEALRTLLMVRYLPGMVRSRVPQVDPDQPAVVLFTSGSEKAPKAVPLTHRNMLTDQKALVGVLDLTRADSVLGFLPAFHSFGLTITGLLPLLTGLRVVHHPDPTAASALLRKLAAYRATILVGTPTFVSYILDRATAADLAAVRLVVVGAEKCPQTLADRCKELAPRVIILEGYGITECAPVVATNTPTHHRFGTLGQPLPCVTVKVVDLDTDAVVPQGQTGMVLVSGPNIFPGYIGHDGPSPFRDLDGKRWYITGDLASVDAEGFLHFAGRLKRFLKAGGEMISLPALEEPFALQYPPTKDGPRVAVEGVELEGGGRRIVLFTTEDITTRDANAKLLAEGFRGVMRLDEVRKVEQIPILGTGKTDYKVLRQWVQQQLAAALDGMAART